MFHKYILNNVIIIRLKEIDRRINMFIPLEGENILCLANVIVLYRNNDETNIIKRDGSVVKTSFTPVTLKKRQLALYNKSIIKRSF